MQKLFSTGFARLFQLIGRNSSVQIYGSAEQRDNVLDGLQAQFEIKFSLVSHVVSFASAGSASPVA